MNERRSGSLPEPLELAGSELDSVAGGRAGTFVKQPNRVHVSIGNHNSVSNSDGDVYIGTGDMVFITQSNTNSGGITGTNS